MMISMIGFILLNISLVHYFYKLKKNQTPKNPIFLKFSLLMGSLLSLSAIGSLFIMPTSTLASVVVVLLGFFVLSTSATFTLFLATKTTPIGHIKVSVGDQILPFKNVNFNSDYLKGKRTLLKFYRGSWCPYCSAELIMLEKLKPQLAAYNIQIMGVSNDTAEQQKNHRLRDKLSHTLLSDSRLDIIRQYGIEHHKALGATADDTINVFGIAMPLPWKMRHITMSIPTSMLIDESGQIVWIDQSDDYRLRASEEAVIDAVKANFKNPNLSE